MPARSKARALLGVALLLAALLHTWRFRHHLTDDAFISFRYLANFFAGHGLVYNPGERVWGYTNFLWTVLLAPLVAAGADPVSQGPAADSPPRTAVHRIDITCGNSTRWEKRRRQN